MAPSFAAAAAAVEVSQIRFLLNRTTDASLARDTTITVPPGADSVELVLTVPVLSSTEVFELRLELRDPQGNVVYRGGPVLVTPATSGTPPVVQVPIRYVGVGANAAAVVIVPAAATVPAGGTVTLAGVALDSAQQPIPGTPVGWRSLDPGVATVPNPDSGRVLAGTTPGTARIEAALLTGQTDTALLTVRAPASQLAVVSGNGQTGTVAAPLAQPAVVVALDAAQTPVPGATVIWSVTGGTGTVAPETTITDTAGRAQAGWTLGTSTSVPQILQAALQGTAATVSFTATATAGPPARLGFAVEPSTTVALDTITPAPEVAALDQFGNVATGFTGAIQLAILNNPAQGTLLGPTSVNAGNGVAQFIDLSIDNVGSGYTLEATGAGLAPDTSVAFDIIAAGGLVSWINAAGGNWSNGANWSTGTVPATGDSVAIALDGTYTVTLDVSDTVAFLTVGAASGIQTLSAAGRSFGTLDGLTVGPNGRADLTNSTVNGPGPLTVQTGAVVTSTGSTFTGDVDVQGTLRLGHQGGVNGLLSTGPGGVIDIVGTTASSNTDITIAQGFTNDGTVRLLDPTAGGRTVQLRVPAGALTNAGGLEISATGGGTRLLHASVVNQGTWTVSHPLTWNPEAAPSTSSGAVILQADLTANLQPGERFDLAGGTFTIGAAQTFLVNGGTFDWTGGALGGTGAVTLSGATLNLTPSLTVDTLGLALQNGAVVNGPGTVLVAGGAVLPSINGTFNAAVDVQGTLQLGHQGGVNGALTTGATGRIEINGTTVSSNTAIVIAGGFTNNGVLILQDPTIGGRTVDLSAGGPVVNAGTIVSDPLGGGARFLRAAIDNQGTVLIAQPTTLDQASAQHVNRGLWEVTSNGDLTLNQSGTAPSFTTQAGATVRIAAGRTFQVNNGAFTWSGGSLTGAGTLGFNNVTAAFTPLFTQDTLSLSPIASTINGPGTVVVDTGATLVSVGSTFNADVVLRSTAILRLAHQGGLNGTFTPDTGSTLEIIGTTVSSNTDITIANGFTNLGIVRLIDPTGGGRTVQLRVPNGILVNQALLDVSAGGGGARFLHASVDNQASWLVSQPFTWNNEAAASSSSGGFVASADVTLNQGAGESFTNSGSMTVDALFDVVGGSFAHLSPGALFGRGTLDIAGTSVSPITGVVLPGNSPGILTIIGPFPQGTGSQLLLEMAGTAVGTGYDRLAISGAATFGGTLTFLTTFAPAPGTFFTPVTFGSRTGQFTTVSGLDLYPQLGLGLALDTAWSGASLIVAANAQIAFSGDSAGGQPASGLLRTNGSTAFVENVTTEGQFADAYPRWEPGFARLTYTSNDQLHVIDGGPASVPAHLVTDAGFLARRARFSPDGVHLALECGNVGAGFFSVCVIPDVTGATFTLDNIGNGTAKAIVTDSVNPQISGPSSYAWNPLNPDQIAVVRDSFVIAALTSNLYVADFDGRNATTVTTLPVARRITDMMDWSPDGSLIAFDMRNDSTGMQEIWVYDFGAGGIRRISTPPAAHIDFRPVFSPNGQEILFARHDLQTETLTYVIAAADGSGERVEIPTTIITAIDLEGHDWSPDGSEIVLLDVNAATGSQMAFIVPSSVTATGYFSQRRPAGRVPTARQVFDKHPSWRP